jgi:hypothetical protein
LKDEYCSILEVIEWLCLATALYTARQSQFLRVLEDRPGGAGTLQPYPSPGSK